MTKQCTSLVGFAIGDMVAQLVTDPGPFDPSRTAIVAAYGFFVDAPAGSIFYRALTRLRQYSAMDVSDTVTCVTHIAFVCG